MKELGQLMTEAVLPVLGDGPMAVRAALAKCFTENVDLLPEDDLAAIVALTEVVFLGLPEGFDPKAIVRRMTRFSFDRLCVELDKRGDSSEGAWVWVQCERAMQRKLHAPGHDWGFVRGNARYGATVFFQVKRTGHVAVLVEGEFGPLEGTNV